VQARPLIAAVAAAASVLAATAAAPSTAAADPGDVVLTEDFSDGGLPEGWTPVLGDWTVRDGRLVGVAVNGSAPSRLTFGPHLDNYRVEATMRFERVDNASRWAGIILDIDPAGQVPWWQAVMRSTSTAGNGIEIAQRTPADAWNVPYTASAPHSAGTGRDVRVAVEVQGRTVTWNFDGRDVLEGRIDRSDSGALGFVAAGATVSIDDVVVTEIEPASVVADDGELPVTIAHRGHSSVAPENTLAAVSSAIRTGAEYVEVDVHTTADDVPVILHDQTVNRTTDGTGDVAQLTAAYLETLDAGSWFSAGYAGQRVPTLDDVLDMVDTGGSTLLLEIKGPETDAEVERIVDAVVAAGLADQTVVQSFGVAELESARRHAPQIPRALLRGSLDADPVAISTQLGVIAYNPSAAALATRPGVVADLNAAGIAVMPYTVNNPADWARLVEIGVDGIITDRAAAFIGWKERASDVAEPTVTIVSPAAAVTVERGQDLAVAVSSTDAEAVDLTLDGSPVGPVIPAAELSVGTHVLRATAMGPGGTATAEVTFTVGVTAKGLRGRLAVLDVPAGQLQQLLTALEKEQWARLRLLIDLFAGDSAPVLQADVDALAGGPADPVAFADATELLDTLLAEDRLAPHVAAAIADPLARAARAADQGSEAGAIAALEQAVARARNQIKGDADDEAVRRQVVALLDRLIARQRELEEQEAA
jgi:glycerophosphoryl diester phosphodiesterase